MNSYPNLQDKCFFHFFWRGGIIPAINEDYLFLLKYIIGIAFSLHSVLTCVSVYSYVCLCVGSFVCLFVYLFVRCV